MNISKKIFIVGLIFILGLSACNLPSQAPPDPLEVAEAAVTATLVALTVNPPLVTNAPVDTPLPTDTPTITPTFTPSVPMVTVSVNTNCRTGPGVVYDLIGALLVGEQAVVVGKYSAGNYWIINNPDASGTCWLWGQYATVSGNTAGLPEYAAPPTPTPTNTPTPTFTPTPPPPNAPANFTANKICTPLLPSPNYNYQFVLQWDDSANNEDGYRVYFNNALLVDLPANSTTHPHVIGPMPPGVPFKYDVEAYNATGASAKKSITVTCP
jgi:hypothetical protein